MGIIRNAISSDKNQILGFCTNTFSWGDYIHEVWDNWITDGGLLIFEKSKIPIAMCHGVIYHNEKMVWIEGIRVRHDHRKKNIATKLIRNFEKTAKNSGIMQANMLIEYENVPSLSLVKKLNYKIISKWNYYSLKSKKKSYAKIVFDVISIDELDNFDDVRFVESWRWVPLIESNLKILNANQNVLCTKKNDIIQSLGIITESDSFHDTIILTIIFGTNDDIQEMISYAQNISAERKYSKIRILTKDDLKFDNLGKKFPFYLVEKIL